MPVEPVCPNAIYSITCNLPEVQTSSMKNNQQRKMRWEITPAVVENDKTAKRERVLMKSSEEDEGLLHTVLIWPHYHGVAVTTYSIHI
jgi:hypothetical protein